MTKRSAHAIQLLTSSFGARHLSPVLFTQMSNVTGLFTLSHRTEPAYTQSPHGARGCGGRTYTQSPHGARGAGAEITLSHRTEPGCWGQSLHSVTARSPGCGVAELTLSHRTEPGVRGGGEESRCHRGDGAPRGGHRSAARPTVSFISFFISFIH